VVGHSTQEILNRDKSIFTSNWFDVSIRRQRAMLMPLVATINWINSLEYNRTERHLEDYL
jgi:hypothetical protein